VTAGARVSGAAEVEEASFYALDSLLSNQCKIVTVHGGVISSSFFEGVDVW
jgi:hypothetical protein